MNKIVNYFLIYGDCMNSHEEKVKLALSEGYELYGSPWSTFNPKEHKEWYYQAVVKTDNSEVIDERKNSSIWKKTIEAIQEYRASSYFNSDEKTAYLMMNEENYASLSGEIGNYFSIPTERNKNTIFMGFRILVHKNPQDDAIRVVIDWKKNEKRNNA